MSDLPPDVSLSHLHPGVVVVERYELLSCIGRGGMGVVWKARHCSLGHDVAIKFLSSPRLDKAALSRFDREARLSAKLGELSRHIVRVQDHGTHEGRPFVVMEFLSGESLAERLAREPTLPPRDIIRVVDHLAKALVVAHQAGVVHLDIKPANVFITRLPEDEHIWVKLLDFGAARGWLRKGGDSGEHQVVGTPSYMSPEQIAGTPPVDGRADLWALGILAYRMAVGRPAFAFGERSDLIFRILQTPAPPPSSLNPGMPKAFDEWMSRALAKQPHDRFTDGRELARALASSFGFDLAMSAPPSRPPPLPSTRPPAAVATSAMSPPATINTRLESSEALAAQPSERVPQSLTPLATPVPPESSAPRFRWGIAAIVLIGLGLVGAYLLKFTAQAPPEAALPASVRLTQEPPETPVIAPAPTPAPEATVDKSARPAQIEQSQEPPTSNAPKPASNVAQKLANPARPLKQRSSPPKSNPAAGLRDESKKRWDLDSHY